MSVDLPDPDGPMIAVRRPAGKLTVTSSSAVTAASPSPKILVSPVAETIVALAASGVMVAVVVMTGTLTSRHSGLVGDNPRIQAPVSATPASAAAAMSRNA